MRRQTRAVVSRCRERSRRGSNGRLRRLRRQTFASRLRRLGLAEQNRWSSRSSSQAELPHGMPPNVLECCADAIGNEEKVKVLRVDRPFGREVVEQVGQ
jgi:hypothetical protein